MNTTEKTHSLKKRNRFFGLIIIGIIFLPMGIAYIMFQTGWGVSGSTTNKGQLLIPPQAIQQLPLVEQGTYLTDLYGNVTLDGPGKKWRLLVPVTGSCDEACEHNLYITRQVHVRLAEKAYRVERIILALDTLSDDLEQRLSQEHPNTLRAQTTLAAFEQWLASTNTSVLAQQYYYLVDQEGYAMMAYDQQHSGQDLLADVKKLLKFTYDR